MSIIKKMKEKMNRQQQIDEAAYRQGYEDAEKGRTENPYPPRTVLHSSWQKGFKAENDYELSVW